MDEEKFKRMLKAKGLRATNRRLVVLEGMADCPGKHLSAEEIYDLVKAGGPEVGLAAIYRTIQLLSEPGVIVRIDPDDGPVRYELNVNEDSEQTIMRKTGFSVTDHEVKL